MTPKSHHAPDTILLLCVIGLTLFGFLMIGSASSVLAERFRDGDTYFFLRHQVLYGGTVGTALLALGYFIPYRRWRLLALPALFVSLVLLILVFIPGLNVEYAHATRWIRIGPISIQPTEITKLAFILYLAALLEQKGEDIRDFKKSVLPFLTITGIIIVLIALQPDIGTLFTITATAGAMVFAAGFRLRHLGFIALAGAAVFALLINAARYRLSRIMVYLHPELDPQGIGYQINQALLAVGTGGLMGLGFGRSRQKYQYLPEPAGDSIFAVIAEELGFIRATALLVVFLVIAHRGYAIARKAPDMFGQLLAAGITSWIVVQAFVNMASILAIIPLTGIPLPFISYGGSALATVLFASGVLLNVSTYRSDE